MDRSNRAEVRNPVLALPAMRDLRALDPGTRALVRRLIQDIRAQANVKAAASFATCKWMMFAYWKIVGVYANHIQRALA
jgi:hypothetical protein